MLTVYSEAHRAHAGKAELTDGRLVPCFEKPERAEVIHESVLRAKLGEIVPPEDHGLDPIVRVHSPKFVDFLRTAHDQWRRTRGDTDALPLAWPTRGLRRTEPKSLTGRLGYYSFDAAGVTSSA